jgi:hypothetical protein
MQNISVTRHPNPKDVGWAGYIQPEDRSWIAFIGRDGRPMFFLNRDPETGAILGDDPGARESDIQALRAEALEYTGARQALHTGMRVPEIPQDYPGTVPPGLVVQPLGIGAVGDLPV